jgi:energy-converting hydrogenase Eha subunit A
VDEKLAHLGFIQGVISRMGGNSFLLKGWSAAAVVACFALSSKDTNKGFLLLAISSVLMFWALDAYFLRKERQYRLMYQLVVSASPRIPVLSLDVTVLDADVPGVAQIMISKTLLFFHGGLLAILYTLVFVIY